MEKLHLTKNQLILTTHAGFKYKNILTPLEPQIYIVQKLKTYKHSIRC